jgi:hypothetical protein
MDYSLKADPPIGQRRTSIDSIEEPSMPDISNKVVIIPTINLIKLKKKTEILNEKPSEKKASNV